MDRPSKSGPPTPRRQTWGNTSLRQKTLKKGANKRGQKCHGQPPFFSPTSCAKLSLWCCNSCSRLLHTRPLESIINICFRHSSTDLPVSIFPGNSHVTPTVAKSDTEERELRSIHRIKRGLPLAIVLPKMRHSIPYRPYGTLRYLHTCRKCRAATKITCRHAAGRLWCYSHFNHTRIVSSGTFHQVHNQNIRRTLYRAAFTSIAAYCVRF